MKITNILTKIVYAPRVPFLLLIKLYQYTLSPDHGLLKHMFPDGYCKFTPSCSEYGYQTIKKHGIIRGIPLTIWRILRCNPWSDGGNDPVK